MNIPLGSRLKHVWNVFVDRMRTSVNYYGGNSYRPDRRRFTRGVDRSIITAVYNRFSMDAAAVKIRHVRMDGNDRFLEEIDSELNCCLSTEANLDQSGRVFIQDAVASMLDEGCVALVPVDTDDKPTDTGAYEILAMRTGKSWIGFPSMSV